MFSDSLRGKRKLDHIKFFREGQSNRNSMDDIHLLHDAVPELDWKDIDLSCRWLGKTLAAPFIINAVTGGPPETKEINAAFARAARETGIGMAVGSQLAAIENKSWIESFNVTRKEYKEGLILANVSAGSSLEAAKEAIDMIDADGIQLHLNVAQELAMNEGDRFFRGWLNNISAAVSKLEKPVIAKEVGFGISSFSAQKLYDAGVRIIDVGGRGGTNFGIIEGKRSKPPSAVLQNWGLSTAFSIISIKKLELPIEIVATGGIKTCLDAAKALALGAKIVGVAGHFLEILIDRGEKALIDTIFCWQEDLKRICLLTGCRTPEELAARPVLISGDTRMLLESYCFI